MYHCMYECTVLFCFQAHKRAAVLEEKIEKKCTDILRDVSNKSISIKEASKLIVNEGDVSILL